MNIKTIVPLKVKFYLRYMMGSKNSYKDFVEYIFEDKPKIIVTLAADYGNLGDVAITIAQEEFLRTNFPEFQIIDFPIAMTYTHMKSLKSIVKREDIITIVGGGNFGDLYPDIEACRQFIIRSFPDNQIISFPQTVHFEKKKNIKKSIKIYSNHPNLTIVAREEFSYRIIKENYKNAKVILTPDIVLSMKCNLEKYERDKVLLLIRNDKESIISEATRTTLINSLQNKFDVAVSDTIIKTPRMTVKERKEQLYSLLTRISTASVVVTNRLHGMIFCIITGTPCVVLPIKGNKMKGVLNWVSDLNYVKCCSSYDLGIIYKAVSDMTTIIPNRVCFDSKFDPLLKTIKEKTGA